MTTLGKNWVVRAMGQKMLSLLPGSAGFGLNEAITRYFRGDIPDRVNTPDRVEYGIHTLWQLQKYTQVDFHEATVLEWGTGWHGIDIILFYLLGANQIFTLDHHPHLTLHSLICQIDLLKKDDLLGGLLSRFPEYGIERRWSKLIGLAQHVSDLGKLLDAMNVRYYVHRRYVDPDQFDLRERNVDIFYSNSVLQRIPKDKLDRGIQKIGKHYMKNGGVFYHGVDQSDIYALKHFNIERFRLAYLQYNDILFKHVFSCRFNYQNRLRESDFISIFSKAKMRPVYMESYYTQADLSQLDQIKLARPFRNKNRLDLGISHTNFFGFIEEETTHPVHRQLIEY